MFKKPRDLMTDEYDDNDNEPESSDGDEELKKALTPSVMVQKGDKIKVIAGDLKGLEGVVVKMINKIVEMKPSHPDIKENLEFDAKDVAKNF